MTSSGSNRHLVAVLRLLGTASSGGALEGAAELLAEAAGAQAAGVVVGTGDRIRSEHWFGADDPLADQLRAALSARLDAGEPESLELDGSAGRRARLHPFGAGDDRLGVFVLVFDADQEASPDRLEQAELLAGAVAARVAAEKGRAAARSELSEAKRWFSILDGQLRVLDRERQKLAAVVGQTDTPMFVVDHDHVVKWVNAATLRRLDAVEGGKVVGLPAQVIWDRLGVAVAPSGSPGCPILRAFQDVTVVHQEAPQRVDGDSRSLYLTCLPITSPDGLAAEAFVMLQDVTDLEVLRRSEARYRLLFERSPNAMIMAEPETGKIVLANPRATALTGYDGQDLAGATLEALHEPVDWVLARDEYSRVLADGSTACSERRLRTRQGQPIVAEVTATRFDLAGAPVTLLELQDVTEKRELEDELRHSQKMEAVGRLAGGVAHEFNNIMTIILGQAELLNIIASADEKICDIADSTEKAAMRAAFLTRKLLAFSRKEAVSAELLDVNEVVSSVEGLLRNLLGEEVEAHISLSDEGCLVRADRWDLEQVAINLAANSRDAMPRGGNFWLDISRGEVRAGGGTPVVVLEFRDDGVGIEADVQQRMFEPFFTTKAPGKGTGLGMATVYRAVERNGGSIDVDSAPGEGARFRITVPLSTATQPRPVAARSATEGIPSGDERVLVVDDEAGVRRMAARLLSLDGYAVTLASSGQEALALCEEADEPFDLLLTDVVMPGMSGVELGEELRRRYPELRVLFMSGYSEEEVADHGASCAEDPFISKPFTRRALMRKTRAILDA